MDYSLSIKQLIKELARQKSYSRLYPIFRVIMFILMLPFIVVATAATILYYVLLFIRYGFQIAVDELEAWLNKRKEGVHCAPESVLYFVTIPTIFFFRVLLTFFSGILYFTWFWIMLCTYISSLGGIRWQPSLNLVKYDADYTWGFNHTKKTFNIFALVNVGLILLVVVQTILYNAVGVDAFSTTAAKIVVFLTVLMIYVVYPMLFAKVNLRKMEAPEDIYNEAVAYAEVKCVANYTRAVELLKKIPDYGFSSVLLSEYDQYLAEKKRGRARAGIILMIILGVLVVLLAIVPSASPVILDSIDNSDRLVYFKVEEKGWTVTSSSYTILNVKIEDSYGGVVVSQISDEAFLGCTYLRTVEVPGTINFIGSRAFENCRSLKKIIFHGTAQDWRNIEKADDWDANISEDYVVVCTDGTYSGYELEYYYYDNYWY